MVLDQARVCTPSMELSSPHRGVLAGFVSLTQYHVTDGRSFTELFTMSSQLTLLVQTFNGSNYQLWSKAMKAWLQSQGLWGFVDGMIAHPADPVAGAANAEIATAEAAIAAWVRSNDMAMHQETYLFLATT